jgi:hypothetical protein
MVTELKAYRIILAVTAFILISIAVHQCDRDSAPQGTKISESVILYEMAVSERKQAKLLLDSVSLLESKRDTLYITRTRTITKWDSIIRTLPADEAIPVRLDSCLEVGEIVLAELASCDSVVEYQGKIINHLEAGFVKMDSSRTELANHLDHVNREVVNQRNQKRLAWITAGAIALLSIIY